MSIMVNWKPDLADSGVRKDRYADAGSIGAGIRASAERNLPPEGKPVVQARFGALTIREESHAKLDLPTPTSPEIAARDLGGLEAAGHCVAGLVRLQTESLG